MIPAYIFSNIEYLFKRKLRYSKFIIDKLFTNLIIPIIVFGFILYLTRPSYIPKDTAVSDLKFMVNTLENVHPDIYHVICKDSFLSKLDKEIDNLPERVSELGFYNACARLASYFGTGHTKPMENLLSTGIILKKTFPFETNIIDNKLFIT